MAHVKFYDLFGGEDRFLVAYTYAVVDMPND